MREIEREKIGDQRLLINFVYVKYLNATKSAPLNLIAPNKDDNNRSVCREIV